jgi:predicted Zn finger-like uncharacterized protein
MDVRCEKCMTVYEFDDSQVGENGVTVKCTQCGNLFKVKKRSTTAEHPAVRSPAWMPPTAPAPQPTPQSTPQAAPQPTPQAAPVSRPTQRGLPNKAPTPAKGVPAQQPTATVQAKRPTPARGHSDEDLAFTTTAPMTTPSFDGPSAMGDALLPDEDPAFASTTPKPRITPPPRDRVSSLGITMDDIEEVPSGRSRMPMYLAAGGAALLVIVGLGFALRGRGGDAGKIQEQYQQGRNLFLMDTEDAFHQADALLQQAHGADSNNPLVLAALGELDATWAGYLRDEAREIEAKTGAAGEVATRTLRKTAQQHLDDAKRYTGDALAISADGLEVNRAMAEFLRVDGAPLAEAERYLKRALDKRPGDAESTYAMGALLFREGRLDEARSKIEQANTLHLGATQKPLFRALYLLGKIDAQTGKKDDARRELSQLTSLNPQHERGRILLASLDAAPAPTPAPVAVAAVAPTPPPAAVAATPTATKKGDDEALAGGDYNKLVAQADRLSENGKSEQARKLYERALSQNPKGVEALTGLGYCDLDGERFMSALDHFKQALGAVPEYGEALLGLAEAYKMRSDKVHAVEFYRRYLKSQPGGPKAAMAQKNLRDLEAHMPPPEAPAVPDDKPAESKKAEPETKKSEAKIDKSDDKAELPRPPPSGDEPPP